MAGIKKSLANYYKDTYTSQENLVLQEGKSYLDCSLGTNPFGCSRTLVSTPLTPEMEVLADYPQTNDAFLREIIDYWREVFPLDKNNIRLEAGTFGAIERINKLYIDENSLVLGVCPQFSDYMQDVACCGGKYEGVALNPGCNYKFNVNDMLAALDTKYSLVYLDNPNNPTGQVIPLEEIEAVVREASKLGIAVLVDEAYGDYMPRENSALVLTGRYDNIFVAKSFTKGFGLAGLRVGYIVMSPALVPVFAKAQHPFPVNALGQIYAAQALRDRSFLADCRKKISSAKKIIISACQLLKAAETDLCTPIMTLIHPSPEVDLFKEFLDRGVITTSGEHFPSLGPNSVRLRIPRDSSPLPEIIRAIENAAGSS